MDSIYETISKHWRKFMRQAKATTCVVGISGGIDSTCVAALGCKIFGKENVIGISLPCDGQKDIDDVDAVFEHLDIRRRDFDIGHTVDSILLGIEDNAIAISETTKINLPARLRMAALYAFSQSIPGSLVINTSNLSETLQNYDTLFGDDCGSYAPIKNLTKTEVRDLARRIGVPEKLVVKTPVDGLQDKTDEERFGYSYEELDKYIRTGEGDMLTVSKILERYRSGKFKIKMVNVEGPDFGFPDYVQGINTFSNWFTKRRFP